MCKYCRYLKELRERDVKENKRLIDAWRLYVYRADRIMERAIDVLDELIAGEEVCFEDIGDAQNVIDEMMAWRKKEVIK